MITRARSLKDNLRACDTDLSASKERIKALQNELFRRNEKITALKREASKKSQTSRKSHSRVPSVPSEKENDYEKTEESRATRKKNKTKLKKPELPTEKPSVHAIDHTKKELDSDKDGKFPRRMNIKVKDINKETDEDVRKSAQQHSETEKENKRSEINYRVLDAEQESKYNREANELIIKKDQETPDDQQSDKREESMRNHHDNRARRDADDANPDDRTLRQPPDFDAEDKLESEGETDFQNLQKLARFDINDLERDNRNMFDEKKDPMLEARGILGKSEGQQHKQAGIVQSEDNNGIIKIDENALNSKENKVVGDQGNKFMNKQQELLQRPISKVLHQKHDVNSNDKSDEERSHEKETAEHAKEALDKSNLNKDTIVQPGARRNQIAPPVKIMPNHEESVDEILEKRYWRQLQPPKREVNKIDKVEESKFSDMESERKADQGHRRQLKPPQAMHTDHEKQGGNRAAENLGKVQEGKEKKDDQQTNAKDEKDTEQSDTKHKHSPIQKPTRVQSQKEADTKGTRMESEFQENNVLFTKKTPAENAYVAGVSETKHGVEDTEQEHGDQNLDGEENDQIADDGDRQQDDDVGQNEDDTQGQNDLDTNTDLENNEDVKNAVELSKHDMKR